MKHAASPALTSFTPEAGDSEDPAPDPSPSARPDAPRSPRRATGGGPAIELEVDPRVTRPLDLGWLRDRLREAAARVEEGARISVTLVDDGRMIELNRRHLGREGTTDVLAFDLAEAGEALEAEIVLCVDEAARRAEERGHAVERELLLYGVHGVLHCAGYDDREEEDFRRMHAEEDRILESIGVGATFSRTPRSEPASPDRRSPSE